MNVKFSSSTYLDLQTTYPMEVAEAEPWEKLGYPLEMFPDFEPSDAPLCLGIDEAGRGPTLGPMVYAAAWCKVDDKTTLSKSGYMDSKKLTLAKREALFASLRSAEKIQVGYTTRVITAEELSGKMLDLQRTNLNEISHNAAIEMIKKAIAHGYNIEQVFVDTVGPPSTYQAKLKRHFPMIDITVSKKADALFPIVSAASIVAKVTRDQILEGWIFKEDPSVIKEGKSWGSGYPADVRTKTWIKSNVDKVFGFPNIMRFSWKPCVQILEKVAVDVKWGEDTVEMEYEDGDSTATPKKPRSRRNSLSSTRAADQPKLQFGGQTRFRFFATNDMEVVSDF